MSNIRTPLTERFWSYVMPEPNSGCWLWMGAYDSKGYARIGIGGRRCRNMGAHRLSLELHGHSVPPDSVVMHDCDNPSCVNPDHLSVGTQADNLADMRRKQRHSHGASHSASLIGRTWKNTKPSHRKGLRAKRCKRGHAMDDANTFVGGDGSPRCRRCKNDRWTRNNRKYKQSKQKKEAA